MRFPIRPAMAPRAVMAAVVLLSASGCTHVGVSPAHANDPSVDALKAPSIAPNPAGSGGNGPADNVSRFDLRLAAAGPAQVQPPLVRMRRLDLDRVRQGAQLVPQAKVTDLPARLARVDRVGARKRLFIKTILPAVLRANAEIREQRDFVTTLIALDIPPDELPQGMADKLQDLADQYQVEPANLQKLKRRVDIVPPALVLAQAAIETGWGTSRFAQQGNALFGQHTRDPDVPGMVPQGLEDPDFRVRAFATVTASVEAYLRNLNTHPAYAELRTIRAEARAQGAYPDSAEMAAGLLDYSARGQDYVSDIRVTIRANDLQAFAGARLRPRADQLVDASSFTDD
ncbi:hypothetical protein CKO28_11640 [Rhodovibrio sodomensis]|uniref:Mannosyl-glycoprotein endo-beta-N-acetylglucosamidase-like domain-containing protein n=1 Tax=Rhodovibrio sodomensis TaxID=1088 RepID=A0ABS1DE52_9PROT|nr:glucosaminidase domain-containing protein [Rhodovibrio sodomensis]MBK1668680.1 hypothetical protein [Rhodovibrio sodomensis]